MNFFTISAILNHKVAALSIQIFIVLYNIFTRIQVFIATSLYVNSVNRYLFFVNFYYFAAERACFNAGII